MHAHSILLRQELDKLDDLENFRLPFDTPNLLACLNNLTLALGTRQSIISSILKRFQDCGEKNVYLVLKWCITIHRLLSRTPNEQLFVSISASLLQMDCPKLRTRHEQYIYTILIKPYCQYLYRICELHQLSCYENDHAELSLPQLNSPQRKGFILYNLLHFMGRQLAAPVKELTGYFKEHYPALNLYTSFLQQDSQRYLKEMQLCFNLERDHPVGLIEKECLGDLLAVFSQNDLFLCTEKLPDQKQNESRSTLSHSHDNSTKWIGESCELQEISSTCISV